MINVVQADITKLAVDAIVNAANNSLSDGSGVNGAIHSAGGNRIQEECGEIVRRLGGCKTGDAVITSGGDLPARYVIHTVGPVWHGGSHNEEALLRNAYWNSLRLAVEYNVKTIAFSNISTGIYGYPKDKAAQIAIDTVKKFLSKASSIEEVVFVCFDPENFKIYSTLLG